MVGAPRESSLDNFVVNTDGEASADNKGDGTGAAYVFLADGNGDWYQDAYLKASNADSGDSFGTSVATDGNMIVVGSPFESSYENTIINSEGLASSDNSAPDFGAAYLFESDTAGNWFQAAYLKAANADNGYFGSTTAISESTILVGADGENSGQDGVTNTDDQATADYSAEDSGAAYLFSFRSDSQ